MKSLKAIALCAVLVLGGCTSVAQMVAGAATEMSSSTPSQVSTLAGALNAADLVTKAAKIAVDTGKLDAGTLHEIDALSDGLHAALVELEAANKAGKSLTFDSFNAGLKAWSAYMTTKGLSH